MTETQEDDGECKGNHPLLWQNSLDWFKGKSTGNRRFYHEIWDFPVIFPLNQSIEWKKWERKQPAIVTSGETVTHKEQAQLAVTMAQASEGSVNLA